MPETQRNPAAPAVATPSPSVARSNISPASTSIAASPKKKSLAKKRKPRARKLPIAPIKSIVPFEFGNKQQLPAPIIRNKLLYFLSLDRDEFKPDSKLMQSKMCASDFVALRLVYEAMRAEPWALRELLDRVDSVPWKQGEAGKPGSGPMVVQIVYESPTAQMIEQQQRIDERNKTRAEKMLDAVKRLPAPEAQSDGQIEYITSEGE